MPINEVSNEPQSAIQPRDSDVYRFTYSAKAWATARNSIGHGDLNWCFDGQLIYRDGRLCDTYWGLSWGGDHGRRFTVAEAQAEGALAFVCNLHDVEKIREDEYPLYADGDAFNLSHQHGCYKYFVRRRGAKKDAERMRAAVHRKVQEAQHEVERAAWNLEYAVQRREQLLPRIDTGEEPSI